MWGRGLDRVGCIRFSVDLSRVQPQQTNTVDIPPLPPLGVLFGDGMRRFHPQGGAGSSKRIGQGVDILVVSPSCSGALYLAAGNSYGK